MNGLPIGKQHNAEKFPLSYLFPLSYPSVRSNLCAIRILYGILNPLYSYFSTIKPLSDIEKIFRKFHSLFFLCLTTYFMAMGGLLKNSISEEGVSVKQTTAIHTSQNSRKGVYYAHELTTEISSKLNGIIPL